MDARATRLRNLTYARFVELGRAPTADEVGRAARVSTAEVEAVWRDLHRAHALVLDPGAVGPGPRSRLRS